MLQHKSCIVFSSPCHSFSLSIKFIYYGFVNRILVFRDLLSLLKWILIAFQMRFNRIKFKLIESNATDPNANSNHRVCHTQYIGTHLAHFIQIPHLQFKVI